MKPEKIKSLNQQEIYDLFTCEKIKVNSPREKSSRSFPAGSGAYIWTNEALCNLVDKASLDLEGRDMLIVSASGDTFPAFAYMNAGDQIGFDTSHRAVLWAELKLKAIDTLNLKGFRKFTALEESEDVERERKYVNWLLPKLSGYAREIFKQHFEEVGTLRKLIESGAYFRGPGCTEYYPNSNIYTENEENYERARKNLRARKQILIPCPLNQVLHGIEGKFGGFYGSNILDHFTSPNGELDYSKETISKFLETINSRLEDGIIILQFEWSNVVKQRSHEVLAKLGYKIHQIEHDGNGYGQLCVARKK